MSNKTRIIAVSGKIGSGKSTLTSYLKRMYPGIEEKFFAEKLKRLVALLAGVDYELTLTQEGKNTFVPEFDLTIGEMCQQLGTDVLRKNFRDDIWIKSLFADIKPGGTYVISDCRFKNEAEELKKLGAVIIRVNRPNNPVAEKSGRDLTHISETDLDDYDFDYTIDNVGTYAEFMQKIDEVYQNIDQSWE